MKKQSKTERDLLKAVGRYVRYHGGCAPLAVGPISAAEINKFHYALCVEFVGRPPVKISKK